MKSVFFSPTNCDFLSDEKAFLKIQTMIKSWYHEMSFLSNNLMKQQSFRAGGGKLNSDKD